MLGSYRSYKQIGKLRSSSCYLCNYGRLTAYKFEMCTDGRKTEPKTMNEKLLLPIPRRLKILFSRECRRPFFNKKFK